ncbi:MAG: chemotaxis protein CheD [Bacillota bacterium]|jgi:chemotaxis protein CheD|nr:chemotaxis protein CheD [Bacillota bacterium]
MNEVFVNMGQIGVLRYTGVLVTVGLGSCVGVSLYDPSSKVGALAHVFLAKSRDNSNRELIPGKYADTAIPALIDLAVKAGANKHRFEAKIAGGAHLFNTFNAGMPSVGQKNVEAVTAQLNKHNIPIIGKEVLGKHGRKMSLFIDSGIVVVTTIGQESIRI